MKLGAKELRRIAPAEKDVKKIKRRDIYIILDNILDTYNVGAIFRLADAIGAKKIFLCGQTETPPNSKIKKASVSTWQWVDWEHFDTAIEAIENLKFKIENLSVVAVEQAQNSLPYDQFNYSLPIALVVGNETTGIAKEVLDKCDAIVELPMFGINKSLNVMVSLGIVLYEAVKENKFNS